MNWRRSAGEFAFLVIFTVACWFAENYDMVLLGIAFLSGQFVLVGLRLLLRRMNSEPEGKR